MIRSALSTVAALIVASLLLHDMGWTRRSTPGAWTIRTLNGMWTAMQVYEKQHGAPLRGSMLEILHAIEREGIEWVMIDFGPFDAEQRPIVDEWGQVYRPTVNEHGHEVMRSFGKNGVDDRGALDDITLDLATGVIRVNAGFNGRPLPTLPWVVGVGLCSGIVALVVFIVSTLGLPNSMRIGATVGGLALLTMSGMAFSNDVRHLFSLGSLMLLAYLGAHAFLGALAVVIKEEKDAARAAKGRCINCLYDLHGLRTRQCPECGKEQPPISS